MDAAAATNDASMFAIVADALEDEGCCNTDLLRQLREGVSCRSVVIAMVTMRLLQEAVHLESDRAKCE
jgi:hypothetical protein